jgi:hypothetical protein
MFDREWYKRPGSFVTTIYPMQTWAVVRQRRVSRMPRVDYAKNARDLDAPMSQLLRGL